MVKLKSRTMLPFLRAADINEGEIIEITGPGKYIETKFRVDTLILEVKHNDQLLLVDIFQPTIQ